MSEDQDQNTPIQPEETKPEVVQKTGSRVEVSADLLNEAVVQLRKMAEIRQRDSERQERAIAQMQKSLKRQGILSRYVVLCCLIVVLISIGLAYLMRQSALSEKETASTLVAVDERLSETAQTIAEETQKQVTSLDGVKSEVLTAREEQVRIANNLEQELRATREIQASVVEKVDEQLNAVRGERDQVTGEVRNLLEEKTQFYIAKEKQLDAEREAIKEAKQRSKEEQQALIQQTIARLNAMAVSLTADEETEPVTDAAIDEAVSAAEDVITEGESAPEPAVEETPAVETPAVVEPTEEPADIVDPVETPAETEVEAETAQANPES